MLIKLKKYYPIIPFLFIYGLLGLIFKYAYINMNIEIILKQIYLFVFLYSTYFIAMKYCLRNNNELYRYDRKIDYFRIKYFKYLKFEIVIAAVILLEVTIINCFFKTSIIVLNIINLIIHISIVMNIIYMYYFMLSYNEFKYSLGLVYSSYYILYILTRLCNWKMKCNLFYGFVYNARIFECLPVYLIWAILPTIYFFNKDKIIKIQTRLRWKNHLLWIILYTLFIAAFFAYAYAPECSYNEYIGLLFHHVETYSNFMISEISIPFTMSFILYIYILFLNTLKSIKDDQNYYSMLIHMNSIQQSLKWILVMNSKKICQNCIVAYLSLNAFYLLLYRSYDILSLSSMVYMIRLFFILMIISEILIWMIVIGKQDITFGSFGIGIVCIVLFDAFFHSNLISYNSSILIELKLLMLIVILFIIIFYLIIINIKKRRDLF